MASASAQRVNVQGPSSSSVILEVREVAKSYGEGASRTSAVGSVTFELTAGELVCVVGPSGCGKTTLLRVLAGLMRPTSGTVRVLGKEVVKPPADLALVFQDYSRSLFPWMRVAKNVAYPLRRLKISASEKRERVSEALASVGLDGFETKYPWQLSGGMQQRVAIARALAYRPKVLLMDEPFASVDAQTRADLEDLILEVRHKYNVTILFVTHDIDESVYLADRVVILGARPTFVREILPIDLPRPRTQAQTKGLPHYGELRTYVYESIMTSKKAGATVATGAHNEGGSR